VPLAIRKCCADDLLALLVHNNLALQRVLFLLPGIEVLLLFFGLSIGVSVASIKTTSYSNHFLGEPYDLVKQSPDA